jgi:hypothetical protein
MAVVNIYAWALIRPQLEHKFLQPDALPVANILSACLVKHVEDHGESIVMPDSTGPIIRISQNELLVIRNQWIPIIIDPNYL